MLLQSLVVEGGMKTASSPLPIAAVGLTTSLDQDLAGRRLLVWKVEG